MTSLALAGAAMAAGSEWSGRPALPGFVVGYQASNQDQSILERIPKGQSVEQWTEMQTSQRFLGRGADPGPRGLLSNMQNGLRSSCPGATTSPIVAMTVSGRPAARMRADCPQNPATGLPETFFIVAFAGSRDLFAEQIAFRRVPTAKDAALAMKDLQAVRWCTAQSREAACKAR